jgi:hypothetical protein
MRPITRSGQANDAVRSDPIESVGSPSFLESLAYEAPFLIEKLVKDHITDTSEEAEALFTEVKRYFVLCRSDQSKIWEMYSLRVDEAWHQFILFTQQYFDFCRRFYGKYIPHSPGNAPEAQTRNPERASRVSSFKLFREFYEQLFEETLPDIWYDEKNVTLGRRVLDNHVGTLMFREDLDNDMVELLDRNGEVVFAVNLFAREALAFLADTGAFYVRELPGDLDDQEKVALVSTLVEQRLLRLGG